MCFRLRLLGCCIAALLLTTPAQADEIGDAVESSRQAQRAARESQQRINKLDDETRKLRERRQALQWRAMQQAAYAKQLEQEAAVEEGKRAGLEAQLARIAGTEKDLLPLMQRMVTELERFVAADLPFLREARTRRVADLKALLADPGRSAADKYRRVLEAYRSEVDYGHTIGAEESAIEVGGASREAALVRIGRVGLYYLAADGTAGAWDRTAGRWIAIDDDDFAEQVRTALAMAQEQAPPALLVLPLPAAAP